MKLAVSVLLVLAGVFSKRSYDRREEVKWSKVPCIHLARAIDQYSDEFDIPKRYAYGIAYEETGYKGIRHKEYKHQQISSVGAKGPMQVMPLTAKWMNGKLPNDSMLFDIDYNVRTSMKLLRHLKNTYGSWEVAFGAYNTGKPLVNQYALNVQNFDYSKHK